MKGKNSVALVDDKQNILTALGNTASAFEALSAEPADVAVLDRPFNGLELFCRLRKLSDMPMIFLSAHAEMLADLDVGADDYISKPFSMRLVIGRIEAVLRRHER